VELVGKRKLKVLIPDLQELKKRIRFSAGAVDPVLKSLQG